MALFGKAKGGSKLPPFHPSTVICDWGEAGTLDLNSLKSGTVIFGATNSGKTSGPARNIAMGLLSNKDRIGFLILCVKPEEVLLWRSWCKATGREEDIIELNESGQFRYNFLEAESVRTDGGGLTLNIAQLLSEVSNAINKGAGAGEHDGQDSFWTDSLNYFLTNLIDICLLSGQPVTLPRLRELAGSAPLTPEQAASSAFQSKSPCCQAVMEASRRAQGDVFALVNVRECATFFLQRWPELAPKTRSIVQLYLDMTMRNFLTMPLYRLFCTDTNFRPEDTFDKGAVIIVNFPVQVYKKIGTVVGVLMKFLMQRAIVRRSEPNDGTYLRPCVIYSDEMQEFISDFDYIYQAVARSGGGITCYIVQNRESLIARIGDEHKVDSLLANLQNKIVCQGIGPTVEWASKLLGERWIDIAGTSVNRSAQEIHSNAGVSIKQERRAYVEVSRFTTLKRGGLPDLKVEAIVFKGGPVFQDGMPFQLVTFDQR